MNGDRAFKKVVLNLKTLNFDKEKAMRHIFILAKHSLATVETLVRRRYPRLGDVPSLRISYRCFMLLRTVLVFILAALAVPQMITVDIFEIFKTYGMF